MDIYIDTANLDDIKQAAALGVLDGVTTNPSLVAREGVDFHTRLEEICRIVDGPVSAEVVATEHDEMIAEAEPLLQIASNIVIKLPSIEQGVKACKTLSDRDVRVNMTLCFQPLQALMAGYKTRILTASIRHPQHLVQAALIGSDVATCPLSVIRQIMKHPLTDIGLERFLADWAKTMAQKNEPALT